MSWFNFLYCMKCTLIKWKPGFSGKIFWSLEIPFKTGFTVYDKQGSGNGCFHRGPVFGGTWGNAHFLRPSREGRKFLYQENFYRGIWQTCQRRLRKRATLSIGTPVGEPGGDPFLTLADPYNSNKLTNQKQLFYKFITWRFVSLNMFRPSSRPSSGAYNYINSLWFYRRSVVVAALLVVVWPARPRLTTLLPPRSNGSSLFRLHDLTQTHHAHRTPLYEFQPTQRPLPDNTEYWQRTDIDVAGGIRTHNSSKRAAANPRLRPRGPWDRIKKICSGRNFMNSLAGLS